MKKQLIRFTSVILSFVLVLTSSILCINAQSAETEKTNEKYSYLTTDTINPEEISNSVVIPGVFQSKVRLYNDDGSIAVNSDGEELSAPFFLDSTSDIVKTALKKCLFPLLLTLFTQHDWSGMLVDNVAATIGECIGGKVQADEKGNFICNLKADYYDGSIADLREEGRTEDIEYIYDQIPLRDYAEIAGEDHLYFFSYASFGNINSIVDDLYKLIVKAANSSPTGKANIIPISQGGSLANDLLERYPQVGEILDRIVYIVPALDGTVLLGEIYEKGLIDDDAAIYEYMLPILLYDDDTPWMGDLVNIILRILPNNVVNGILDKAVDVLVGDFIKYNTCMWALLPQANYPGAAKKYLSASEDKYIRAQTDAFYNSQIKSDENILHQIDTYGVKVFDIVDYNSELYPICDSWNKLNADGIIQLDSTSMGATSIAVDERLPDNYTNPKYGNKYIDKYRLIDAGTGLLPDSTFYFHNQNHERTARNDIIMKLATCLLTDNSFTSIESYPEKYPQFNEGGISKELREKIATAKGIDTSKLSADNVESLYLAINEANIVMDNISSNNQDYVEACEKLETAINIANGTYEEPALKEKISNDLNAGLTVVLTCISALLFKLLGGKGFSDIFRFF